MQIATGRVPATRSWLSRSMRSSARRIVVPSLMLIASFGLLFFTGCTQSADIVSTMPADGQTNVSTSSAIEIVFSTPMDEVVLENPLNYVVLGSVGGSYPVDATYDDSTRTLTLTPLPVGTPVSAPPPPAEDPMGGDDGGFGGLPGFPGSGGDDGGNEDPDEPMNDPTPAGLPDDGVFVTGETIIVTLTSNLTSAVGIPLDTFHFSFTIAGASSDPEPFEPDAGEFLVNSTDPDQNALGVERLPTVDVTFRQPIHPESVLPQNVAFRGEISGFRTGTVTPIETELEQEEGEEPPIPIPPVTVTTGLQFQLSSSTPLVPGERVTMTLTNGISAPATIPGDPDSVLRPYVLDFHVMSGSVGDLAAGLSDLQAVSGAGGVPTQSDVLQVKFGEYVIAPGSDLAVLDASGGLSILERSGSTYLRSDFIPASDFLVDELIDFVQVDCNDDGAEDLVVLTDGPRRIDFFIVVGGQLELTSSFEILGAPGTPRSIESTDIDGNGLADLILGFSECMTIVAQTSPGLFAVVGELPADGSVDEFRLGDIDEDGLIDIAQATPNGIIIKRNAGNFQFVDFTTLDTSLASDTFALDLFDFEGDGDLDVVCAGDQGVLVYENPGDPAAMPAVPPSIPENNWSPVSIPLTDGAPEAVRVFDLDADGLPELITYEGSNGVVTVHERMSMVLADLEPVVPNAGVLTAATNLTDPGFALGDTNDDSGIDVLLFGRAASSNGLFLSTSNGAILDEPVFVFSVPDLVGGDISEGEYVVTVSATLEEPISGFTVALDYDDALTLDRVEADPATFDADDISLTPPSGDGFGIVTANITGNPVGPTLTEIPLVRYVFTINPVQVGSFPYELSNSLSTGGPPSPNEVVPASNPNIQFPVVFSNATGSIEITSAVPAVENLTCEVGENEVRTLNWQIPIGANYNSILIALNGQVIATLNGLTESFTDASAASGALNYEVTGTVGGLRSLPATCTVTVVPAVLIGVCERDMDDQSTVRINWAGTPGNYDSFTITRDGNFVGTVPGSVFEFVEGNVDDNEHLYQVVGVDEGVLSNPSDCLIGAIGAGGMMTDPPTNVVLAFQDFNDAALSWLNAENYASVRVTRLLDGATDAVIDLPGSATTLSEPNLPPGDYQYLVTGFDSNGLPSDPSPSAVLTALLPPPTSVICVASGGNDIDLTWVNGEIESDGVPILYDNVQVIRDDGSDAEIFTLPGDATSFTDSNLTDGDYTYTVRALLDGDFADSGECSFSLRSRIRVNDLVTAVAVPVDVIEVRGDVLDTLDSFSFTLSYSDEDFDLIAVTVPGAPGATLDASETAGQVGTTVLSVTVTDANLAGGQDIPLVNILGSVPADFAIIDALPTSLDLQSGTFTYTTTPPFAPELIDGTLQVTGKSMQIDSIAGANLGTFIAVPVHATYDVDLQAFQAVINYDPAVLNCVEVSIEGTVSEALDPDFFFSGIDDDNGAAFGAIFAFPGFVDPLPPNIRAVIVLFLFQIVTPEPTTTEIFFGQYFGASTLTSQFTSIIDTEVLTFDPVLLGGQLDIISEPVPPAADAIAPDRGPLAGGVPASITGDGFFGGANLEVLVGGAAATIANANDIQIDIIVPPAAGPGDVDVTVTHDSGTSVLTGAYTYEALTLVDVDPPSGDIFGGEAVTINGTGLDDSAGVLFGTAAATVTGASADGTQLFVTTPAVPFGTSVVDVTVNLLAQSETLPGGYTYTSNIQPPTIDSISPDTGPEAGGTEVTVTGSNFDGSTEVTFGGSLATGVIVLDASTLMAITPAGVGVVDVFVSNPAGSDDLTNAYTYESLRFDAISPDTVTTCGGVLVTIDGGGMVDGLVIRLAGLEATDVTVNSNGSIATCLTPQVPSSGTFDVELENPGGAIAVGAGAITFGSIFIRGDANNDGVVELNDVTFIANFVGGGGPAPAFLDAVDTNDDGVISVGDVVYLANFVTNGGAPPPPPFPDPGPDPTADSLDACAP